jgi:hypothetical protein
VRTLAALGLVAVGFAFADVPLVLSDAPTRAHLAYNKFGILANAWSAQHDDNLWSKADHHRLEQVRAAWKTFDRLAREAQF